jgi:hypothetical protein
MPSDTTATNARPKIGTATDTTLAASGTGMEQIDAGVGRKLVWVVRKIHASLCPERYVRRQTGRYLMAKCPVMRLFPEMFRATTRLYACSGSELEHLPR